MAQFASHLSSQFPSLLDVVQPCQLAIFEAVHGAGMLLSASLSSSLAYCQKPLEVRKKGKGTLPVVNPKCRMAVISPVFFR